MDRINFSFLSAFIPSLLLITFQSLSNPLTPPKAQNSISLQALNQWLLCDKTSGLEG